MQLAEFPRRRFIHSPTPLEPLSRLSAHLGGPTILAKRDDCTGLALGGQQDPQAGVHPRRGHRRGRRYAGDRRRGAVEPLPPDRRGRGASRAEMRARAVPQRRLQPSRIRPHRQCAARPHLRRRAQFRAPGHRLGDGAGEGGRGGAPARRQALRHPHRRVDAHRARWAMSAAPRRSCSRPRPWAPSSMPWSIARAAAGRNPACWSGLRGSGIPVIGISCAGSEGGDRRPRPRSRQPHRRQARPSRRFHPLSRSRSSTIMSVPAMACRRRA